jgi:hypothetical protein
MAMNPQSVSISIYPLCAVTLLDFNCLSLMFEPATVPIDSGYPEVGKDKIVSNSPHRERPIDASIRGSDGIFEDD